VLGISNMGMNTLELKITSNTQNKSQAFQAAASVIERVVQAEPGTAYRINFAETAEQPLPNDTANPVHTSGKVAFRETASGIACPGNSLRVGCNFYDIDATGTHAASGAASRQVQGLYRIGVLLD
jgi:Tfp pilus assembly protein PilX